MNEPAGNALPEDDLSEEFVFKPHAAPHSVVKGVFSGGLGVHQYITTEVLERIGSITIHNPSKRNALSEPLLERFIAAFATFESADVRVVVLRAGPQDSVWSAGHDIEELEPGHDPLAYTGLLEKALRCVRHFRFPVIAMVHGSVWGGACDLALNCDLTIGDTTATFAITPALLGVPYNSSGLLHVLNRVGLNVALEMFVTASPIAAERALRVGILNHLVEPSELEPFTYAMARKIASNAPLAVSAAKEQLRLLAEALPLNTSDFERIHELRQQALESEDFREGLRAFREHRKPNFTGR
ncbi:MAG: methylmalonyl-CoA decarboxylase [Candidatus Baltobacteraceae bacterium]